MAVQVRDSLCSTGGPGAGGVRRPIAASAGALSSEGGRKSGLMGAGVGGGSGDEEARMRWRMKDDGLQVYCSQCAHIGGRILAESSSLLHRNNRRRKSLQGTKHRGHAKHSFRVCISSSVSISRKKIFHRHHLFFYSNTFISFVQHPSEGMYQGGIMFFCLPV